MVSTGLTRARRFQAALALDPLPASKLQSDPLEIAEVDKHDRELDLFCSQHFGRINANARITPGNAPAKQDSKGRYDTDLTFRIPHRTRNV